VIMPLVNVSLVSLWIVLMMVMRVMG